MPFRFGVVTLREATQAFARVLIETAQGTLAWGAAAEMLAPKWFDKNLALTNEQNEEQLRTSLRLATALYLAQPFTTAFGLFRSAYPAQRRACAVRELNTLIAGYGPAMLDRAVLDALCRAYQVSFYEAIRGNAPGIEALPLTPDLEGFDFAGFLSTLSPAATIHARHTVGLVDPITSGDLEEVSRVDDGLPETLEEVVTSYGHVWYKLKVGGNVREDVARLVAIASVLDGSREPYHVTLDGNEQYRDVDAVLELWRTMQATPALGRLSGAIAFIEQPITRARALEADVGAIATHRPVIIDESDADLESWPAARARGYTGVSSKTCKGLYKSILNLARCAHWNAAAGATRYFMSAEDLTTQPGISVQQDLALVSLLDLGHVERNAHHYVNGMSGAPRPEQHAFAAAHPDLYHDVNGVVRLRITAGRLALGSLACPGFAVAAEPAWDGMRPVAP
jgi:hypothetical protein